MTESECIEILKYYDKQPWFLSGDQPAAVAFKMAIQALEEVEQYRAIGTVEDFKAIKQWKADIIEAFCKYDVNSVEELRASVIDKFMETFLTKATEASEKVVFDGGLVADVLTLDCVSDMVLEIALDMKGEKE